MGEEEQPAATHQSGPDAARVVVFHSNEGEARRLAELLRAGCYDAVARSRPEELKGPPEGGPADAILLDVGSDEEELKLCRTLREGTGGAEAPIILAVSPAREGILERARQAGASEVIVKPINEHELLLRVSMVLRREHMHKQLAALKDRLKGAPRKDGPEIGGKQG